MMNTVLKNSESIEAVSFLGYIFNLVRRLLLENNKNYIRIRENIVIPTLQEIERLENLTVPSLQAITLIENVKISL